MRGSASTDYVEGIEYEGGLLSIIHMEEGRIVKSGGTYTYEYMLRDHLGNARSGFRHSAPTTASLRSDHYPFGLQYPQNVLAGTPVNRYLYNGKELQDGLGVYDYGARLYDPVIARWNAVDPMAEVHFNVNPYNYVLNNPISFIDLFGLDTLGYNELDMGEYKAEDVVELNVVAVPPPSDQGRIYGGDGSGSFHDRFMHKLDMVNQYLPTTHILNSMTYAIWGEDYMGNEMSLGNATLGAVSILPIGKIGGAAVRGIGGVVVNTSTKLLSRGMTPNAGGNIVSFTTKETSTFFRVYSGNPNGGAFLTKMAPKSSAFAREGLALPNSNTASFIQRVTVPSGVTLQRSRALGAFGRRGGLEQFQILNFDSRIIFHPGVPLR